MVKVWSWSGYPYTCTPCRKRLGPVGVIPCRPALPPARVRIFRDFLVEELGQQKEAIEGIL